MRQLRLDATLAFNSPQSQAKFAVRAKAHELQHGVIRLAINQHQIRLDVAIPVVFPIACQRVVAVLLSQWLDGDEITLRTLADAALWLRVSGLA